MSHEVERGGRERGRWRRGEGRREKIADCGNERDGGGGGRRKWNSSGERVTFARKSKDENNRAIKKTR